MIAKLSQLRFFGLHPQDKLVEPHGRICVYLAQEKETMYSSTVTLAYGTGTYDVNIPDSNLLGVYGVRESESVVTQDESLILRNALNNPIGTAPLRELVHPGVQVAIITSDLTRPCPSDRLLPPVLEELRAAGIPDKDILIVLALGVHRPMTEAEIDQTLSPEIHRRFRVLNHDPDNTVHLGETRRGTPVDIFRPVVEADIRICLGALEFHWFAGFSGGAKAILPGCASMAFVTKNHAMLVLPEAAGGRNEGNPLRADLEEGVSMLGVDFILNVVLDPENRIQEAVAGDVIAAHRAGCELISRRRKVYVPRKGDIVLASPGGYPKDINLFQSHKGLENASHFVRQGGILILVAECREMIGNQNFEDWMLTSKSPQDILERMEGQFILGGHKAAALAATELRIQVYLVSALPADLARRMYMQPFDTPQAALDHAMEELGLESQVIVLPHAISILPDFG